MSLTRREFLRSSTVLAFGTALAACSRDGGGASAPTEGTFEEILAGRTQTLTYIPVGTELLPSVEERLTLALVQGGELLAGATGRLWIAKGRTEQAEGPFDIEFHGEGLPPNRGYYEATVTFPSEGAWHVLVEAQPGDSSETLVTAGEVHVGSRNAMPKPGDRAISVETPTTRRPRGVDPICTRTDEGGRSAPCGMHARSLADALDAGERIVLFIATPGYCRSQLCGPEVELLRSLRDEAPATYFIADGRIEERLLGPADLATFRSAVERLASA